MSLGRCYAGHSLSHKLDIAKTSGFEGIELFYEDLVELAKAMPGGSSLPGNLLAAAGEIKASCDDRALQIICLQPFMHYEGLIDRELHSRRVDEMNLWIKMAHALGTDLIMLPSSNLPLEQMGDIEMVVSDLVEIADIGLAATPVVRFAFEALCWGTRVNTWEGSWEVIQKVNRSNFGICLDTFNIAGRIYADPTAASGRTQNCNAELADSMDRLANSVPRDLIFLLQIADGELLSKPLAEDHEFYNAEQPSRMS